eukprot:TRINITY_DN27369_c0_g1_i1.p1 TRINITY_DN27369_c0_g1~~TRINITY_DN27369_c0_g1_i1.p1  ORF type:complete len:447 (-),score=82.68 TRINITY_DN27369_c0_g1_i1:643-1797(-)
MGPFTGATGRQHPDVPGGSNQRLKTGGMGEGSVGDALMGGLRGEGEQGEGAGAAPNRAGLAPGVNSLFAQSQERAHEQLQLREHQSNPQHQFQSGQLPLGDQNHAIQLHSQNQQQQQLEHGNDHGPLSQQQQPPPQPSHQQQLLQFQQLQQTLQQLDPAQRQQLLGGFLGSHPLASVLGLGLGGVAAGPPPTPESPSHTTHSNASLHGNTSNGSFRRNPVATPPDEAFSSHHVDFPPPVAPDLPSGLTSPSGPHDGASAGNPRSTSTNNGFPFGETGGAMNPFAPRSSEAEGGGPQLRVKCFVEGSPYGVSVDLGRFSSTSQLRCALLAVTEGTSVVYQDKDGDMVLLGDETWEFFLHAVRKMYIRRVDNGRSDDLRALKFEGA